MVDLDSEWQYRTEALSLLRYMGVQIVYLRSDNFRCFARSISICINPPTTIERLRALAHEAAHVGFGHISNRLSRHRQEFETGSFEILFLQYLGIEVQPTWIEDGKRYVADIIRMAINRGINRFDEVAWKYADYKLLPKWCWATFEGFEPLLIDGSEENGYRKAMLDFGVNPTLVSPAAK